MTSPLDKQALKDELVRLLAAEHAALVENHEATLAGVTHEEAKPENDKDTRAIEQSYLARGQATRVLEVEAGVGAVRGLEVRALAAGARAALGALVAIEDEDGARQVLIAPYGGGRKLAGGQVQVVTPQAPLGKALIGKREGDELEVTLGGKRREIAVVGVR